MSGPLPKIAFERASEHCAWLRASGFDAERAIGAVLGSVPVAMIYPTWREAEMIFARAWADMQTTTRTS